MVHIEKFVFSPFQENTYVLYEPQGECIIVDPGCYFREEQEAFRGFIERQELNPVRLLNTHCHLDHVFGNAWVHREWQLLPEYHALEKQNLALAPMSAQLYGVANFEPSPEAKLLLREGTSFDIAGASFDIIWMPGHAPGHLAFYCESQALLVSGDVIFREGIGRTDLPGGDHEQLFETIRNEVFTLPEETIIYSGHGPETHVGHEKKMNPFFR